MSTPLLVQWQLLWMIYHLVTLHCWPCLLHHSLLQQLQDHRLCHQIPWIHMIKTTARLRATYTRCRLLHQMKVQAGWTGMDFSFPGTRVMAHCPTLQLLITPHPLQHSSTSQRGMEIFNDMQTRMNMNQWCCYQTQWLLTRNIQVSCTTLNTNYDIVRHG